MSGSYSSTLYNSDLFIVGGAIPFYTFSDTKVTILVLSNMDGNDYHSTYEFDYTYDESNSTIYFNGIKQFTIVSLANKHLYLISHSSTVNNGWHLCDITPMHQVANESVPTDWHDIVPVTVVYNE